MSVQALAKDDAMDIDVLLTRFGAAAAAGDGTAFAALFTPDGRYDDGFFGVHEGRASIAAMLERFHVGGEDFRWQFLEPLGNGTLAYFRYIFSYRSKVPESAGQLVVFDGMARLRLQDGLIADYAEVFDRGVAFVQLGFSAPHVHRLLTRSADQLRGGALVQGHLRWRDARAADAS